MSQHALVSTENAITDQGLVNVIQDGITCTVIYHVQLVTTGKIVNISATVTMEPNAIMYQENAFVLQVSSLLREHFVKFDLYMLANHGSSFISRWLLLCGVYRRNSIS